MLYLILVFLGIGLIAWILGYPQLAGRSITVAKILFVLFIVLFLFILIIKKVKSSKNE